MVERGVVLSAGDEGDDDVGGVLVEVRSAVVVSHGRPRVSVSGRDLHVPERDVGFEGVMKALLSMCGWRIPSPARLAMKRTQR